MSILNSKYREFRLENGLVVAIQETPTQTIAGGLKVYHGALHEVKGEEGVAHLLEHALMTGGSEEYTPEEADRIRGVFAGFNACTTRVETSFPVNMLPEDVELYLSFVNDVAFRPRLGSTRVEEERKRVLREIAENKSRPQFDDERTFWNVLFDNGPQVYYTLGRESVIRSATPEDLRRFHQRGYHANNASLILVGGLPQNIEDLIRKHFEKVPQGPGKRYVFPELGMLQKQDVFHTYAPDLYNNDFPEESRADVDIAWRVPHGLSEHGYPIRVLSWVLGNGQNSRLFRRLSQREGLAYRVSATYGDSVNASYVYIEVSVPSRKQEEAVQIIFDEMEALKKEKVDERELKRLVRASKYYVAERSESNVGHVEAIQSFLDHRITFEMGLERLSRVTSEDVLEAARRFFPSRDGNYVLMVRDPLK